MRTIPYGFPLLDLVHELCFTSAQLKAHPLGAPYARDFDALLADTQRAVGRQTELVAATATAESKVLRADDTLNTLLDQINLALLRLVGNRREAPLYQRFFGRQTPSRAKRPILGAQLELMRGWLPTLQGATAAELNGLAAPLAAAVKSADAAVAALRVADQQGTDFAEIGEHKELIDQVNGVRKATYGKLAEAVHANPADNLPADFAEGFFLREGRWTPPSRPALVARIGRTEAQLTRLRQQLAELDEAQAQTERMQREAQAAALRDEVSAIERHVQDEQGRAATLKTRLDQLGVPAPQ